MDSLYALVTLFAAGVVATLTAYRVGFKRGAQWGITALTNCIDDELKARKQAEDSRTFREVLEADFRRRAQAQEGKTLLEVFEEEAREKGLPPVDTDLLKGGL